MSFLVRFGFLSALILLCASLNYAATIKAGGLGLELDADAKVTAMSIGETNLRVVPAPLVTLCEVGKAEFAAPQVTGSPDPGLALDFAEAKVRGKLVVRSHAEALRFSCNLKGEDLPARGMLLRFALPFDADGWQWHNDMQTAVTIAENKLYENVRPLRAYADLPEWKDEPALRMGYSNRNFCTVLTGPVGICLAVPIDKPSIFRTAYDGDVKQLEIVYDFALSPDTRKPNEVDFTFDLYQCDPNWAFRSALARYYRLYPELFRTYVRDQGQWMAFSKLSEIDNANEFYFALQEGAPEPEYDDKLGVLSCPYFTHAGMGANIPNYDPEADPLPPHEVQVEAMEAAFKARTKLDGIYHAVGLHDAEGKLDVRKWRVYAHLIAQFNLDPELPYGEWTLERAIERIQQVKQSRNADLDGFYYDGLSAGINYRPDHFGTADAPCLWDPVAQKPFINNFFSSCEFARAAAELLRPRGLITMMNGALGASFYVAPWLDVLGAETGLRIPRESFNYIRATTYHKPFLTLLKGNYEQQIGRPEMELFHKRCLAYGVFPGFFDWPPSGLGPGGRYWYHSRYYERDRDIFRKYQPLCRDLALAGWEPVTYARSSEPQVFVERFGPTSDGIVWLTLLNEDSHPHKTSLTIDAKALQLDPTTARATDVVTGAPIELKVTRRGLAADLEIPSDGVMALQIAHPHVAAQWRVAQALETLDRGILMRQVDKDKPPLLVRWLPQGKTYTRETVDGKTNLVFEGDGNAQSTSQWAMLFQPSAEQIKLRVRASGQDLVGAKGSIGVRCRLAWVTSSYTHYDTRFFDLDSGTYDWKDFEFTIESEQALRSIYITPTIAGSVQGTLKLAKVSLSDTNREEYVIDPEFSQWYEPVPDGMRERVESECQSLRTALLSLQDAVGGPSSTTTRERLGEVSGKCRKLSEFIVGNQAENGCRRVLRDLETIEQHLGFVTLAAFGIKLPQIKGPMTAAPGDEVGIAFPPPEIAGVPTSTELVSDDVSIPPNAAGCRIRVPADAEIGSIIKVVGLLHIGAPDRAATVKASHQITVVPALEMTLESHGADQETGACRARVILRNNRTREATALLAVTAPEGWRVTAPATLKVPAGAEASAEAYISPTKAATPGSVEVNISATADTDTTHSRITMLYIPREANLLKNPSFEEGGTGWGMAKETVSIATEEARSGAASLRIQNPTALQSETSQSVGLNQQTPCAILVRASSKAKEVSGSPGKGYSLYVDIYYMDGTPLYGQTYNFDTGTTDWQMGELYIEPAKPIRHVNLYLLLRGKSGTAYFDDVALMEDPRRKGNIAREAQVAVDSNYSGYDPSPINDGLIAVEELHWTKQAWASEESPKDHFITLKFDQPREIAKVSIYWSLDAGIARNSRELQLQIPDGDGWKTVATAQPDAPVPVTDLALAQPVSADSFRLFQPGGQGPSNRQGLMWVREVELFPPQ